MRVKPIPKNGRRSVQVCEARRSGKTVKQVIVRHVGVAADDAEEKVLRELGEVIIAKMEAEQSDTLALFAPEDIAAGTVRSRRRKDPPSSPVAIEAKVEHIVEEKRVVEGIGEIFGTLYDELGFDRIVPGRHAEVHKATVLARVAEPVSKHRTSSILDRDYGLDISVDRIYRMMDALYAEREHVQDAVRLRTLELFGNALDVCFFDVTTLYFESVTEDSLRGFGYSKDQKFHTVQVVLALATTREGLPVGYRLFHGSTAEVCTLVECVRQWREKADIGKVTFVADRGMMSEKNLAALEAAGFHFIVGTSLKKLGTELEHWALSDTDYRLGPVEQDCVWSKSRVLPKGRILIASYSAQRARKDASDRQRIVDRLEKRLGKNPSRAAMKKLVSNRGYLKFTQSEGVELASIDQDKVARDAAWDGMYGIVTNLPHVSALEVLARYRQLWTVELAFRVNKTDLRMRPIYHWKPERIEAHVALCFLAYAVATHAQHRLRAQNLPISIDALRNELGRVQASILRDTTTGKRFRLPSALSPLATDIFRAFARPRSSAPSPL